MSSLLLQERIGVSSGISRRGFDRGQRKGDSKQNSKPAPSKLIHLGLLSIFQNSSEIKLVGKQNAE